MDARQLHKRQYEAEVKMKPTVLGLNLSFTTDQLCDPGQITSLFFASLSSYVKRG